MISLQEHIERIENTSIFNLKDGETDLLNTMRDIQNEQSIKGGPVSLDNQIGHLAEQVRCGNYTHGDMDSLRMHRQQRNETKNKE